MTWSICGALVTIVLLPALNGQPAKVTNKLETLGAFLGVWDAKGTSKETPYSKAGRNSAETNCRWSPNHGYLVCDQTVHIDGGVQNDLSIYTYNETNHAFAFFGLSRNDSHARTPELTIDDKFWTYSGSFDQGGKHVQFRTVNEFVSATKVVYRAEYSEDGTNWKLMMEGINVRRK